MENRDLVANGDFRAFIGLFSDHGRQDPLFIQGVKNIADSDRSDL